VNINRSKAGYACANQLIRQDGAEGSNGHDIRSGASYGFKLTRTDFLRFKNRQAQLLGAALHCRWHQRMPATSNRIRARDDKRNVEGLIEGYKRRHGKSWRAHEHNTQAHTLCPRPVNVSRPSACIKRSFKLPKHPDALGGAKMVDHRDAMQMVYLMLKADSQQIVFSLILHKIALEVGSTHDNMRGARYLTTDTRK
jgi:hypothetical protein